MMLGEVKNRFGKVFFFDGLDKPRNERFFESLEVMRSRFLKKREE